MKSTSVSELEASPIGVTIPPQPIEGSMGGAPVMRMDKVQQRLAESGYAPLKQIKCQNESGVLVLRGRVPSYYLKQLAQTIVRDVAGVSRIVNDIRVD